MDVLNPRGSAYSIFSSMGSSDSDNDFQKSELDQQSPMSIYGDTPNQMSKQFHHVRVSHQE